VAAAWEAVRSLSENLIDRDLVEAAHADSVLRTLFPLVSHGSLQFSRCTRFPWSQDLPSIFPGAGSQFRILQLSAPGDSLIGVANTPQEAVGMVRDDPPENCAPAIDGTPDQLPPPA